MSDVSTVTNHFPTVNEGFITTVAGSAVTSGGTSVQLASVSGLTNASIFVGIIEPGEANEQVFTGTVDTAGSQITDVVWTRGTDVAHPIGSTVVDYVTGTVINMITKGILTFANQDGTLKAISAPSATLTGALSVGGATNLTGVLTTGNVQVNGRATVQVQTLAAAATITPNADSYNIVECVALDQATTIANPSGTPVNGQIMIIRLKDNGTARALTYGAIYQNVSGLSSLTTTVAGKWHVLGLVYNSTAVKWQIVSITTEA